MLEEREDNMQEKIVSINDQNIVVKEYKGRRVVTFKDIDTVHERTDGTARKRFNDNRKHFVEGEDYFVLSQPSEIRTLGIERPQGGIPEKITLITESGYLMLVKSFTDDLAWDVQRQLVKRYFAPEPIQSTITYQYPLPAATFEGVANLGRLIERIMRTEGACPHEIAIVLKPIFEQAGLEVNERFIKIPAYEQYSLDVVMR